MPRDLARELTAARNRLFHDAGGAAAQLPRLADQLTLIVERTSARSSTGASLFLLGLREGVGWRRL